jgi:Na+-translocating ferredoxin:NAD+ oxidoreductase RNF subunit RnfB
MMNPLVIASLIIGGTGLASAVALAVAARFFAVHEDPRIEEAIKILPGVNCGGCGFAGCADYAKGIVINGAAINLCLAGGADVIEQLSKLLGVTAEAAERRVAIVLCNGDSERAPRKFTYNGVADCTAVDTVGGGDKLCGYGCLGYASCARACPSGAIEITANKLAVVHPDLCISCAACVKTCPRKLIKMVPESSSIHVLCSSKDKGPIVKRACSVGCIGCTKCTKTCDPDAIAMDGALAVVDYAKPLTKEEVIESCPTNCIVERKEEPCVSV